MWGCNAELSGVYAYPLPSTPTDVQLILIETLTNSIGMASFPPGNQMLALKASNQGLKSGMHAPAAANAPGAGFLPREEWQQFQQTQHYMVTPKNIVKHIAL